MLEPVPDGLLLADKPAGISSHRAVAIARRVLGTRKIGHAGTLDPMATGLLILGVGPSTRLLTHLVGLDKRYTATMRLGIATDSDDADGAIVDSIGMPPDGMDADALEQAMAALRGPIDQVPSTVSAISVDGKRAYQRVRAGETVVLPPRPVTIRRFEALGAREHTVSTPTGGAVRACDVDVVVECTSGTYVRALARDVGRALGVGGHLVALRRMDVGPFSVDDAVDIDDDAAVQEALIRPTDAARALFPVIELGSDDARDLSDGKRVAVTAADDDGPVAAVDGGTDRLVGLVAVRGGRLRVLTNFPPPSRVGGSA
ncbi:tRNA pseudouridine(55) synthase TruB [Curtobacterium ammoniigenes]|uniref:tRNA pseudouridine(55) synthase TruB n=1 Tax=Curtobacterium ammoniigenes TaxID=395387 RepID=UPI00083512D8|nr:tRNA pseudouridine(55) synthase TruB [Curtobacterium ammoniigenes]